MGQDPGGEWLTMTDAAELVGVHRNTIRNRCKSGRYRHRVVTTPHGEEFLVSRAALVADLGAAGRTRAHKGAPHKGAQEGAQGGTAEPIEAAYQVVGETPTVALVPLATMVEELRGLADQLADLARRNEGLALEVGQLRERVAGHESQIAAKNEALAAKDETVAAVRAERDAVVDELRRRAEAAEDEIAALRTRYELARRGEKESDHRLSDALALQLHPPAAESSPRHAGLRARLGRWWRGEG